MTAPSPSSRARAIRLLAGLLGPVIAFLVLLHALANSTEALAITEAIPTLWVLAYATRRRRIEPVGATAVAGFGIALLVTIASGGSSLPLELHRAVFPGAVGLACLISLVVHRPLLSVAKNRLAQAHPEATAENRRALGTEGNPHALATLTAIIGTTLLADAAAQIVLAFTVSTSTFGVVAHIASWAIIATGLAICAAFLLRVRVRLQDQSPNPEPTPLPTPEPTPPPPPEPTPPPTKQSTAPTPGRAGSRNLAARRPLPAQRRQIRPL